MQNVIKGFEKSEYIFPDHLFAPEKEQTDLNLLILKIMVAPVKNKNEPSATKTSNVDAPLVSSAQCNPVGSSTQSFGCTTFYISRDHIFNFTKNVEAPTSRF